MLFSQYYGIDFRYWFIRSNLGLSSSPLGHWIPCRYRVHFELGILSFLSCRCSYRKIYRLLLECQVYFCKRWCFKNLRILCFCHLFYEDFSRRHSISPFQRIHSENIFSFSCFVYQSIISFLISSRISPNNFEYSD